MDEDYVTHMLQKYRLAVALAILRNKPNNISVENYITELQSKIRGSELDETLSNIDVDEEDFNLSDGLNTVSVDLNEENSNDSITILQNYDLAGLENEDQNSLADVLQILDNYEKNQALESTAAKETSTPNLSQINILETIQNQAVNEIINSNINTDTDIGYSKLHNDNLKAKIQSNFQKDFSFNETQNNINKDENTTHAVINDVNIYDSQETEIYTLHGIPEYNTHISQSQDNFVITKNFLINKQKENINQQNNIINNINVQDTDTNIINDKEVKSKVYNFINEEKRNDNGQDSNQESQSIQVHLKKKLKPIQYTENSEQENTNFNISQIQSMESETNIFSNMENHKIDLNQRFHKDFVFSQESQLFSLTCQESAISGKDLQKEYENLSLRNSKDKIPTETNISLDFGFLNTSHNSSASKIHNSNNSKKRNYSDFSQNSSQSELLNLNSKSNSKICHSSQNYSDSLFCVNTRDSLNEESHEHIENVQNTCEFNNIQPSNSEIFSKIHSDNKMVNMTKPEVSKINDIEMEFEPKINKMNTLQNSIEKPYIEINSHLENEYQICSENAINNSLLKINQPKIPDSGPFIHSDGRQYQNSVNERNIVNENEEVNNRHELINERNTVNVVNERDGLILERNTVNGRNVLINEGNTVNESTKVNERNTFESDSDAEIMKDLSDSQAEVIPFKVMEELNKIKIYLNKRNRIHSESHGTDSGYKSNSRESYLTASQSSLWLNQSSHCLFSYLSQCPLLVSTMEINYEVAKVLGLLIDRLHDDEKYPTFLEEMLEFIDKLLHNIYNGDFDDENVFLKNDESIDRLILLNKSQNIIKFTIEKITKLLENFHERLEKGSHVELENINTAENLCFIFHLLEVLLKKHTTNLSQTSQQSRDEKILKRSTLTEIWRKKWNLTQAEVYHKQEKRDVIVMCSDVLNKIIVKSMENYSLVAFAALQCFNLLQS